MYVHTHVYMQWLKKGAQVLRYMAMTELFWVWISSVFINAFLLLEINVVTQSSLMLQSAYFHFLMQLLLYDIEIYLSALQPSYSELALTVSVTLGPSWSRLCASIIPAWVFLTESEAPSRIVVWVKETLQTSPQCQEMDHEAWWPFWCFVGPRWILTA